MPIQQCIFCLLNTLLMAGAQPRLKSWGDQGLGPTPERLRPALGQRPDWVLGACGRGSPSPAVRVRGYHPRKIFFENSDVKSCILHGTCCEISCFLKTTAKKSGNQYIVGSPDLKVGGPCLPGPYGCCAYVWRPPFPLFLSQLVSPVCMHVFILSTLSSARYSGYSDLRHPPHPARSPPFPGPPAAHTPSSSPSLSAISFHPWFSVRSSGVRVPPRLDIDDLSGSTSAQCRAESVHYSRRRLLILLTPSYRQFLLHDYAFIRQKKNDVEPEAVLELRSSWERGYTFMQKMACSIVKCLDLRILYFAEK